MWIDCGYILNTFPQLYLHFYTFMFYIYFHATPLYCPLFTLLFAFSVIWLGCIVFLKSLVKTLLNILRTRRAGGRDLQDMNAIYFRP